MLLPQSSGLPAALQQTGCNTTMQRDLALVKPQWLHYPVRSGEEAWLDVGPLSSSVSFPPIATTSPADPSNCQYTNRLPLERRTHCQQLLKPELLQSYPRSCWARIATNNVTWHVFEASSLLTAGSCSETHWSRNWSPTPARHQLLKGKTASRAQQHHC